MKGTCVTCGKPLGEARFFVCTDCVPEEMYHDEVRHGSVLGLAVERAEKSAVLLAALKKGEEIISGIEAAADNRGIDLSEARAWWVNIARPAIAYAEAHP